MRRTIRFIFRGTVHELETFEPTTTLLEWLREERGTTGTKEGCNEGDCGACTVVLVRAEGGRLTYNPVNACILLLGQVDGAEILTVEDLAEGNILHPIQAAMVKHHASQCGFCTPGIVMSLFAAFHAPERPMAREAIADCLAGNLCRCTGYRPILDAALEVMHDARMDQFSQASADRFEALSNFADGRDIVVGNEARFFASPARLDTLTELAANHPEATLLAGATDIGLWVTKKLADLPRIIALGRVIALKEIVETEEALFIGAGVTHAEAMASLAAIDPDLEALMHRFASKQVRASGTVGGNIANGSPIGDLPPALIALGASLHLRHRDTDRDLPLEDFFLEYGKQDRAPGEIVTGITIPRLKTGQHFRAFKISKRRDEDISSVLGAFRISLDGRSIAEARIAFGGMAGTPKRAFGAEAALIGISIDDPHAWMEAIKALETDFQPISDMRASAAYRARIARALVGKALSEIAGAPSQTRIAPRAATEALHA